MSGKSSTTLRSKRPGRSRASSRTSRRLVAAIRITPVFPIKPSISANSWFSACSRSSWPPPIDLPRLFPKASISSINKMQGACFLASSNKLRTRDAPTPTNISMNAEPLQCRNGTPASPATALASKVLPVPGSP